MAHRAPRDDLREGSHRSVDAGPPARVRRARARALPGRLSLPRVLSGERWSAHHARSADAGKRRAHAALRGGRTLAPRLVSDWRIAASAAAMLSSRLKPK